MNKPIGIFDSGIGGLSVFEEIVSLLPNESVIYLADNKNCPYGDRSEKEIMDLSIKNVDFLLSKKCKIIVIACNTATGVAINRLRKLYKIPFVGMEPAVKPASILSKTKNVGILATKGTFNGNHFKRTSEKFANGVNLHQQIGYGLVEYIEKGEWDSPELYELLQKYLSKMVNSNVDQIVLGCTHYPFLSDKIRSIIGDEINIINPAPAVAKRTAFIMNELKINAGKKNYVDHKFFTTGEKDVLKRILEHRFELNSIITQI